MAKSNCSKASVRTLGQLDNLKVGDIDIESELLIVRDDAKGEASVVCP